jgi:secreted trypsin-like serine protease
LGDTNLNDEVDDKADPIDIDIDSVTIHPNYYLGSKSNDIALIKLDKWIDINASHYIRPACLQQEDMENGKMLTVAGWGNRRSFGSPSEHLMKADLKFVDRYTCKSRYGPSYRNLGEDLICAIGKPKYKKNGSTKVPDACQGDR